MNNKAFGETKTAPNGRTYWEGIFGDVGPDSVVETFTEAIAVYKRNPQWLQERHPQVYEYIKNNVVKGLSASIDTSKYGRSGKAALKKLSQNEYINADLTKPENEYTQKWIQLFDKYYNLGRENKPMPLTFEQGELEAEFPPFILDEIYRAGKADYEAQQKKEAKKAWQREEAGEDNKKTEGSFEATMYHGKGKSASEIYTNTQYPVLGEGSYYAFSKKIAAKYGKDVTESKVSLKNPYIIRDDVDWRELLF